MLPSSYTVCCAAAYYSDEGDSNASGGVGSSSEGYHNSQTKDLQDHDATQTKTRKSSVVRGTPVEYLNNNLEQLASLLFYICRCPRWPHFLIAGHVTKGREV